MLSIRKKISLRERLIIRSFFSQLLWKVLAWIALGIGLVFLGGLLGNKEHISRDFFGEVYQKITKSSEQNLHKFFLGDSLPNRQNFLKFALIFLGTIIILNIIVAISN